MLARRTMDAAPGTEKRTSRLLTGHRIGTIRTVGAQSRFVLVETVSPELALTLGDGQELRGAQPETGMAGGVTVLRVARERRLPFVVADVLSGEPHAGDEVYFAQGGSTPVVPAPPTPPPDQPLVPATLFPPGFRTNPNVR